MNKIIFAALGGAFGTILRYLTAGIAHRLFNVVFPVGTLAINLTGSFVIGLLWGLFEELSITPNARVFLFVGILGGFTTFSTYALESFSMIRDGEIKTALSYVLASNIFGIALTFTGFMISRFIISNIKGV